jgi:[ribosomal protein S5]-alanine N-acetyltransferase
MFKTQRLILRDYRTEDWEAVHIYGSVPEFSQYEMWGPNTIDDSKNFVNAMVSQAAGKDRYKFDFAVCLATDGRLIGGCGLRREVQRSLVANLGWAINPDYQCQGYATEAASELIRFGFEELGLKLIYATCDARNIASACVMVKLGLEKVGLLKGNVLQKGHLRDTLRFEITPK